MKLLLTSTGLTKPVFAEKFLELISKNPKQIKIAFIPTASSRSVEDLKYIEIARKELLDLGIPKNNIKELMLDKKVSYTDIADCDAIYVCGGNTFYLLKRVRESGFDKAIKEFVAKNKLYLGVSAGTVLVCPNIDIATPFDPNDVGLRDLTGLNLIDFVVEPHYNKKEESIIQDFIKKHNISVVGIRDDQALLVLDGEVEIIE